MKSATDLLLERTYQEIWYRGEKYANAGKAKLIMHNDKEVEAQVKGTQPYHVHLKFAGGGISKRCDCPYAAGTSPRHSPCKHMIAVAILWDQKRGIRTPNKQEIEDCSILPPLVSRSDITAMYKDPLRTDLEVMRIAASESGHWSRPHSRLPNLPAFNSDEKEVLSPEEVKNAFREITRWSNRRTYDLYFCAGEMVAGFCEVMRLIKKRLPATSLLTSAEILREAQKFHFKLILELIDDSEGLHVFTEAHLQDLYQAIKNKAQKNNDVDTLKKLKEYEEHRGDY